MDLDRYREEEEGFLGFNVWLTSSVTGGSVEQLRWLAELGWPG